MTDKTLFLEDLYVGRTFASGEHLLTEQDIIAFAAAFDPQVFHLDAEKAKATVFQGLAASGWHTAAVTMRLLVSCVPMDSGLVGFGGEIAWPQAARPGDRLRVEATVLEIRPSRSKPDRGVVTTRVETRNQRSEVLQVFTTKTLAFSRERGNA